MLRPRFRSFTRWLGESGWALAALAGASAGAQKFAQPTVVATGGWPQAVYTADLNGDGLPDLVYLTAQGSSGTSVAHVLLGDGKGGFSPAGTWGTYGSSIAVGDFAGAGRAQMATAVQTGPPPPNSVLQCQGSALQVNVAVMSPAGMPAGTVVNSFCAAGSKPPVLGNLAVGKIHDGKPVDLLMTDAANNTLYVIAFGGNGSQLTNASVSTYALPHGAGPIFTADLDNDGHPDVVVNGTAAGTADVWLGNGLGGLTPLSSFVSAAPIKSLLIQDVNFDGRADLIAESANGHIDVYPGNGDGTFSAISIGGTGALDGLTGNGGHLIALADLNRDGLVDALTATPIGISALLGNGTAYLGLKGIYNAGPGRSSYAVADFNSDGNLDLAVDSPEGVAILFGNADGSFQTNQAFAAGQPAMSGATGVFTASGNVDAVVSTAAKQAQMFFGKGDGTFAYAGAPNAPIPTTNLIGSPGLWSSVLAADINGDGYEDLVLTADGSAANLPGTGDGLTIQLGDGSGRFQTASPVQAGPSRTLCAPLPKHFFYGASVIGTRPVGPSIFNRSYDAARLIIEAGQGPPGVFVETYVPDDFSPCSPFAHNLIVAGRFAPRQAGDRGLSDVFVQSEGHWFYFPNANTGLDLQHLAGDLAVDGSLTTAGQLTAPALSEFFDGPSILKTSGGLGVRAFVGSAIAADLDQDGNQDLLVVYANLEANLQTPVSSAPNFLYVWFSDGAGGFTTSAKHPFNPVQIQLSRNYYQVQAIDLDGDGIADLILSDGSIVSVQKGKGDGTFGAETHFLAGQGINTVSVADVNHDGKPDLIIANGGTVLSNPVANLEVLTPNPDVNTGGITVLLNQAASAQPTLLGTLSAAPEPSPYSSAFNVTATFAPASPAPTGTVSFAVDGIAIGSAAVSGSTATMPVPANVYATLALGNHALSATYSGDSVYAPGNPLLAPHAVTKIPTSVGLALCVDPPGSNFPCGNPIVATPVVSPISMFYGQTLDGVAIESGVDLTGTITFYSGATIFCVLNANLQGGSNTCPPNSGIFPAGTTTSTAVYSGDSTHEGSTSNAIVVTVLPDPTAAVLTTSSNPANFGQTVTFSASVQGNYAPAVGPVSFFDGATPLGTATLDASGNASFAISTLPVGTHPITVRLARSANFLAVVSAVLNQVIVSNVPPLVTAVQLASNVNPSTPGQAVTFTATVAVAGASPGLLSGRVVFVDGAATIGSGTIDPATGIAVFTTATLALGSHNITATYPGQPAGTGAAILPGTSAVLTQVVAVPPASGFTLTVSPVPVTVGVGRAAVLLVTVRETGAFSQPVQLSCAQLAPESTCSFVQTAIPAGGGATTLQVFTAAPHPCGVSTPYFLGSNRTGTGLVAAMALPGLVLFGLGWRGRRRPRLWLAALAAAGWCGLAAIGGCGTCTDLGTKPGSYTFNVVGAATGGPSSEVESQRVSLTVQVQ